MCNHVVNSVQPRPSNLLVGRKALLLRRRAALAAYDKEECMQWALEYIHARELAGKSRRVKETAVEYNLLRSSIYDHLKDQKTL